MAFMSMLLVVRVAQRTPQEEGQDGGEDDHLLKALDQKAPKVSRMPSASAPMAACG